MRGGLIGVVDGQKHVPAPHGRETPIDKNFYEEAMKGDAAGNGENEDERKDPEDANRARAEAKEDEVVSFRSPSAEQHYYAG